MLELLDNTNLRRQRVQVMLESDQVLDQIDMDNFRVKSQTHTDKSYIVSRSGKGLICECTDNKYRHSDCKHIHFVKSFLMKRRDNNKDFIIMERSKLNLCKFYDSGNIIKKGIRRNKKGNSQVYQCQNCNRKLANNFGFENTRVNEGMITGSIQMYYSDISFRDIANH